jgi:hypothetical protein
MDLAGLRGFLHGECVFQADGQGLLHHDVNAVTGANFDYATVVIGVGINEDNLGVHFRDHVLKVGEYLRCPEAVAPGCHGKNGSIGFHKADDLDLSAAPVLIEESVNMAVDQPDDGYAKRGMSLGSLGKCGGE